MEKEITLLRGFGAILISTFLLIVSCSESYVVKESYDSGTIKLKCQELENGTLNGNCIAYYESGQIKYSSMYKNGDLHGKSIFYHRNGAKHWEVYFEKGIKNGEINYYDSLGKVYQTSEFVNNELNGVSFEYYPDGSIKTKANYNQGMLDGTLIRNYQNADLMIEEEYRLGKLVSSKEYDEEGELISKLFDFKVTHRFDFDTVSVKVEIYNSLQEKFILDVFTVSDKYDSLGGVKERVFSDSNELNYSFAYPKNKTKVIVNGFIYAVKLIPNSEEAVIMGKRKIYYEIKLDDLKSS
jgi:antitoxin component YwqK of YwqJK toxin-antitoxin module